MADVLTSGNVMWAVGPDSAISDVHWAAGPVLAEVSSLKNISAAVKIDGADFNVQASDQVDDRSYADRAGAQSRGFQQASGSIEVFNPGKGDTTSDIAQAWDIVSPNRTRLTLLHRIGKPQATALAAGDEINVFRVITDDRKHNRSDASRSLGTGLVLQGDMLVSYIIPSATANPVTVTPAGPLTLTLAGGANTFLRATYEGHDVTAGADWVSSNEAVFKVTKNGIVIPVAAGTANLSVTVPGSAAGSAIAVTVS